MLSNELSVADVLETNWKYFVILCLCLIQHFLALSLSSLLHNEMLGSLSSPTKSLDNALVLLVCLHAGLLKKLWTDSDDVFREFDERKAEIFSQQFDPGDIAAESRNLA